MTFLDPDAIRPVMDAISSGWRSGRRVRDLQFGRWEERAGAPLSLLRRELEIPAEGLSASD